MNKKSIIYLITLLALASCQRIDDPYASMFEQGIVFQVEECDTKAPTPITLSDLNTIYVSATGTSAFTNATFTKSGPSFAGNPKVNWPQTDPGYKFLASNVTMSSGSVTLSSGNSTDIVCAYNASPTYKATNNLAFKHILTRIRYVSKGSYADGAITVSSVQIKNYGNTGTYSISGDSWSGIGTTSTSLTCNGTTDNNLWFIPGTYTLSITYTDATGSSSTRSVSQTFSAGVYYDITCTADDSAKPVISVTTEYDNPTFDSTSSFNIIPASGGSAGPVSVSNVKQKRRTTYKYYDGTTYTTDWETFTPSSYTTQYSKDNSSYGTTPLSYDVPSLKNLEKEAATIGYLYTRVIANSKTSDTHSVEVRQAKNEKRGTTSYQYIQSVNWHWAEDPVGDIGGNIELQMSSITTVDVSETSYSSGYKDKTESPYTWSSVPDETTEICYKKKVIGDSGANWGMDDEYWVYVNSYSGDEDRSWVFEVELSHDNSSAISLLTPTLRQEGSGGGEEPSKFNCGFKVNGTVTDDYGKDWEGIVDHIELLDKDGKSVKSTGISSGYTMFEAAGTSIRIYIKEIKINSTSRFSNYDSWKNVILPEATCDAHFHWSNPTTNTSNGTMTISANGTTLTNPGVVITIKHNMNPLDVQDGCLCSINFE